MIASVTDQGRQATRKLRDKFQVPYSLPNGSADLPVLSGFQSSGTVGKESPAVVVGRCYGNHGEGTCLSFVLVKLWSVMLCTPFPSVGYTWSYVNTRSRGKLNPHPHQWQFSQGPTHLMTKT